MTTPPHACFDIDTNCAKRHPLKRAAGHSCRVANATFCTPAVGGELRPIGVLSLNRGTKSQTRVYPMNPVFLHAPQCRTRTVLRTKSPDHNPHPITVQRGRSFVHIVRVAHADMRAVAILTREHRQTGRHSIVHGQSAQTTIKNTLLSTIYVFFKFKAIIQ